MHVINSPYNSVVNPKATEKELQRLLDSQEFPAVFAEQLLVGQKNDEAQRLLKEVSQRHTQLISMLKSIQEVQNLYDELSAMVHYQEHLMQNIDSHVNRAITVTRKAEQEIKTAVNSRKRQKKV